MISGRRRSAKCKRVVDDLVGSDRARAQVVLQHEVVQVERFAHAVGKARRVEQILRTYRATRDLVFVRGPDAAPGGSDLRRAALDLARQIERHVILENQRAVAADRKPRRDVDAGGLQLVDLG